MYTIFKKKKKLFVLKDFQNSNRANDLCETQKYALTIDGKKINFI